MTEQANDNTLTLTESQSPPNQPEPQFLLRQARERVGLHLAALAVTLKVPVARLEALEAGRYDELPDPTFTRALAKSVCKVLKIDPEPILATLPSAHVADLGPTPTAIRTPMPVNREGAIMGTGESMVRVPSSVLAAAFLIALALVLWFLLPERLTSASSPPLSSTESVMPAQDEAESMPLAEPGTIESVTESIEEAAEPTTLTPGPTASQTTELAQGIVQIKAQDTVWVQIVGASGRVMLQRSLEAQESVAFSNDLPLSVVLGRADEVTVRVRNEDFDLQPWTRGNVARFEVQ